MFEPFPKISRLSKKAVVTEKIDGTNAQIYIEEYSERIDGKGEDDPRPYNQPLFTYHQFAVWAGSRNRFLDTSSSGDNFGFAKWVGDNIAELVKLGPGRHFGEWWGKGIGPRGYGLDDRRFSLFNTARWGAHNPSTPSCCSVVPVVGHYPLDKIDDAMMLLKEKGSFAAPGYMNPEGIIVYHEMNLYKKTFDNDEGKWSQAA